MLYIFPNITFHPISMSYFCFKKINQSTLTSHLVGVSTC